MKLMCLAECRAIARVRVLLGDPSKDVHEYTLYTYLGEGQSDICLQRGNGHTLVSRHSDLMELGAQYELTLTDEETPGAAAMWCYMSRNDDIDGYWDMRFSQTKCAEAWRFLADLVFRAPGPVGVHAGGTYYLAIVVGPQTVSLPAGPSILRP